MFAGGGIFGQILKPTCKKFKFGGQPSSQPLAFYVNLKEMLNNRFGIQSEIYWDDASFGTQLRYHWCRNILIVNQRISNGM